MTAYTSDQFSGVIDHQTYMQMQLARFAPALQQDQYDFKMVAINQVNRLFVQNGKDTT